MYTPDNTIIPKWTYSSGALVGASNQDNVTNGELGALITFQDDSDVGGQTFEELELTITDGLGNIIKKSITTAGDTVELNNEEGIDLTQDLRIVAVCKTEELNISQNANTSFIRNNASIGNDSTENPYVNGEITSSAKQVTDSPGFDVGAMVDVFIVRYDDGSIQYERPIGTVYEPVGGVYPKQSVSVSTLTEINFSAVSPGAIPECLKWSIKNVGGANGLVNGVTLLAGDEVNGIAIFNPVTGEFKMTTPVNYDPQASNFTVTYYL